MTSLVQRKTSVAKAMPKLPSQPIQELDPDFVISISYQIEKDEVVAKKNLEALLHSLYNHGFFAQVRPQDQDNLLVFIKLGTAAFQEAQTNDLLKSFEYGVPNSTTNSSAEKKSYRLRIVNQILIAPQSIGGVGIKTFKFVNCVTPITASASLYKDLSIIQDVQLHAVGGSISNTESIKNQYGTKVALYFEYLKYYTVWLSVLSVFGIVSTLKLKNRFSMTYTFINLLWGILFITFWNRRERYLSNIWGVENSHLVDEHYSELAKINEKGSSTASSSNFTKSNSGGVRFLKQLSFIPIALLFVATLVSYQLGCFVLEIFLSEIYDGPAKILLTLIPTVLISVFVPILTIVFNKVAQAHINWEGHDNEFTKANSNLIKLFVLTFLTSYMPLLITSFVYLPFAHLIKPNLHFIEDSLITNLESHLGTTNGRHVHRYLARLKNQEDFQYNQERLNAQFFYFIVTNQVIQVILKYVLPFIIKFVTKQVQQIVFKKKSVVINDRSDEKEFLDNVRKIVNLPEYNVNDDYRALCVQYGYLIIFGPVWSLAPLVSTLFNSLTFKLDIMKLNGGKYFQPPIPQRVDSIHPWKYVLFGLTWLGLIISPILTSFYRHGTRSAPVPEFFGSENQINPIDDAVADAMGDSSDADQSGGRHRHRRRGGRRGTRGSSFLTGGACVNSSCMSLIATIFLSEHFFFLSYFALSKISHLFKSVLENENDSRVNDIKIRREFYTSSQKETPALTEKSDVHEGLWEQYGFERILRQANSVQDEIIPEKQAATQEEKITPLEVDNSSSAVSSKDSLKKTLQILNLSKSKEMNTLYLMKR